MKMTRYATIKTYPALSLEEVQDLIRQKNEHIVPSLLPDDDKEWHKRLEEKWWATNYKGTIEDQQKPLLALRDRLLQLGGYEVCLPDVEEDLGNIMAYGQLWDNLTTKLMKGRPCKCHANSAELWYNNRNSWKRDYGAFAVITCTGYALSEDGVWRQHSWLIQAKPRANVLIETTVPRVAYYGFGMTYEIAELFEYYCA